MAARRVAPRLLLPLFLAGLQACAVPAPPCPAEPGGESAPSAGCFTVDDGGALLLIEQRDGRVSLPGGSSDPGESARCTAHRETWEETGLDLHVADKLVVFETGFILYRCDLHAGSGEAAPHRPLEVRSVFFKKPAEFDELDWRFPQQQQLLYQLMRPLQ